MNLFIACVLLISTAIGPKSLEQWLNYLDRPLTPETPLNYNLDRVVVHRDAATSKVVIIDNGDSQMGISDFRSTGAIDNFLDAKGIELLGILMPFAEHGKLILDFNPTSEAGGWTDSGELGINDDWGDGNTSHHFSVSRGYTLSGSPSGPDHIADYLAATDLFTLSTNSRITFRVFYRKVNDQDINLHLTPIRDQSGSKTRDPLATTTVALSSGDGTEIGSFDYVHQSGDFWTSNPNNTAIGFSIRVDSNDKMNPPAQNDRIQILGALIFQSSLVNNTNILDTSATAGLIYCSLFKSGYDASELLNFQSRTVRTTLVSALAQVMGNGTTNSIDPIDTINYRLGHNIDIITGDYVTGLKNLRDEWNAVIPQTTIDGSVTHHFFAPWGTVTSVARMRAQADELFSFCRKNNHGFTNQYLFYNGTDRLSSLSGNNPFGTPYGTYVMDILETHPNDIYTPRQIWADNYQHTDPENRVTILKLLRNK